eukprot:gene3861-13924_t
MRAAQPLGVRAMTEGLKGFKKAEKAVEDIYFSQEDQRSLNKLLHKVQVQSDMTDQHVAAGQHAAERSAISFIVQKYKMTSDYLEKLMQWKHTHY